MLHQWFYPTTSTETTSRQIIQQYKVTDVQQLDFEYKLNSIRRKILDFIELEKHEIDFIADLDKKHLKQILNMYNHCTKLSNNI